jgi:hypothetical protein
MFKALFFVLIIVCFSSAKKHSEAKEVKTVGIVEVSDRSFTGNPSQLMLTVINDSEYAYYTIENPDEVLFRSIGKRIRFNGKVKIKELVDTIKFKHDTTRFIPDTIFKKMIEITNYDFIKE